MNCSIRRADDVGPLTDGGTLIMRRSPYVGAVTETLRTSIAPFSIDLDDEAFETPAGIGDALGERYKTMRTDNGERSRFAGMVAGLIALGIGVTIGYVALTESYLSPALSMAAGRPRHEVTHVAAELERLGPDTAETRLVSKPKVRKKRVVVDAEPDAVDTTAQPTESTDAE